MAQRNKGLTQEAAAATTGISVRSGRRIEKGQWQSSGERHWRTRQDPLEAVWLSDVLPLLAFRPQISPTTVLEYLQDKYPGQYPDKVRRTLQRRIRIWKACHGEERETMFRQEHQPGMRALSDFTQLKGSVITINGCPLEHKLFHFRLKWSRWSWMRVVTGSESFTALAEGLQEALGQLGGVPAEHRTDSVPGSAEAPPMAVNLLTPEGAQPIGSGNGINRTGGQPVAREHVVVRLTGDAQPRIAKLDARLGYDERYRAEVAAPKDRPAAAPQAAPVSPTRPT